MAENYNELEKHSYAPQELGHVPKEKKDMLKKTPSLVPISLVLGPSLPRPAAARQPATSPSSFKAAASPSKAQKQWPLKAEVS